MQIFMFDMISIQLGSPMLYSYKERGREEGVERGAQFVAHFGAADWQK